MPDNAPYEQLYKQLAYIIAQGERQAGLRRPFAQSPEAAMNTLRMIVEIDKVPPAELLTVARWAFVTGKETAFHLTNMRSIQAWRKPWAQGKAIITACDKYQLAHPGETLTDLQYYGRSNVPEERDVTPDSGHGPGSIFGDLTDEEICELERERQTAAAKEREE